MNRINVFKTAAVAAILTAGIFIVGCGDDDNPAKAPEVSHGSFIDLRDNKTYRTVTINSQTWMAENLNYAVAGAGNGAVCYRNEESNCNIYGRLYDWNTAITACPDGWHLPTNAEWTTLVNAVGGMSTAGIKLKSQTGWDYDEWDIFGTDDFGFSALPGGYRDKIIYGGYLNNNNFSMITIGGYWWTSSENNIDTTIARMRYMFDHSEIVGVDGDDKRYAYSVRCVRD